MEESTQGFFEGWAAGCLQRCYFVQAVPVQACLPADLHRSSFD